MNLDHPYSLSEDDLYKLQRTQESIQLMGILFGEVQRASCFTPQMISSCLETMSEEVLVVIQSMASVRQPRFRKTG